ncbi:RPII140-upstream gene protein [Frankliniella occidentalis]|uniref:Complex I assembly factor TIMMDC1, mitochondrial n=1 Tax=Frankliniella occidentalis TaxID=133901 RepID=A0A6J1S1V5_FRAOC|nr:RPII140-upstream gene protein [Frankliniella occidentalis]
MNISKNIFKKMLRRKSNIFLSFLPFVSNTDEPGQTPTDLLIQQRYEAFSPSNDMSGWERVKLGLLTPDDIGEFGPHVSVITTSTFLAAIAGFGYGGFQTSRSAYMNFMKTNQATKFDSHMEAKRRLQDRVSIGYLKGGTQLGWRTGLFAFMFTSVTNAVSLYRNKDGILEYTAGGLIAGISYRMHRGTRAVIVGGILGSTLGTIGGVFSYCYLKLFGVTMEELREANYKFNLQRQSWIQEGTAESNREDGEESLLIEKMAKDKKNLTMPDNLENVDIKS